MPKFLVTVTRTYWKEMRYEIEAPNLQKAELMPYENGKLVWDGSLKGGEDEVECIVPLGGGSLWL